MRALLVILLLGVSVHAQSLADAARKERERQSKLKPVYVFTAEGAQSTAPAAEGAKGEGAKKAEDGKPAAGEKPKEPPKPQPPAADPNKEFNDQLEKLRARIRALQDEEAAAQLQVNQLTNQVYAPVVDQAAKDQALARLGEAQQKLAAVRLELDQTKKTLDTMQLQGAPKK